MLEKLLQADPSSYDLTSLRITRPAACARLPGRAAQETLERFGPCSTTSTARRRVAYAASRRPRTWRPTADAGRHARRDTRVVDEKGKDVPPGDAGRISPGAGCRSRATPTAPTRTRLDGLIATGTLGSDERVGSPSSAATTTCRDRRRERLRRSGRGLPAGAPGRVRMPRRGVEDPSYGSKLVAHVVLSRPVDRAELQDWVRSKAGRFAVPREVHVHEELPATHGRCSSGSHLPMSGGCARCPRRRSGRAGSLLERRECH